jgi:hypothetical protein
VIRHPWNVWMQRQIFYNGKSLAEVSHLQTKTEPAVLNGLNLLDFLPIVLTITVIQFQLQRLPAVPSFHLLCLALSLFV